MRLVVSFILFSVLAEEKDKDGNVEEGEQEPAKDKDKDAKKDKESSKKDEKKEDKNKTAEDANKTGEAKGSDKPKIKVVKVPIKYRMTNLNVPDLVDDALEQAKQK